MSSREGILLEVPILKDLSYQGIENYISDLKRAKEFSRFKNDSELIFLSLTKSERTSLYNDMSKEDEKDLTKFGNFLRSTFGMSPELMFTLLKNIRQEVGENPLQFFNRLIRLFYKARGTEIPDEFDDDIHKLEITQSFIHGLRNTEVKREIARNKRSINFKDLGKTAMDWENIEKSYGSAE